MRLTVLLGGVSAERDVSLSSGLRMAMALRELGHTVTCFDPAFGTLSADTEQSLLAAGVGSHPPALADLAQMRHRSLTADWISHPDIRNAECVVLGLHGGQGEDGTVQAALDLAGVPYSGSGHLASALAMDKHLTKIVLRHVGVPTADWVMAPPPGELLDAELVQETVGWPAVVKPSRQGSTVGLSIVNGPETLHSAVEEAYRFDDAVMVERFVKGREFTVGIVGDRILPVIEIVPSKDLYDYECKYTPGMTREFVPDDLSAETVEQMSAYAKQAFEACGLDGYGRVDFRMDQAGGLWCLELNTLPGMTPTSLIPQAASAAGLLFPALCGHIVQLALASRRRG